MKLAHSSATNPGLLLAATAALTIALGGCHKHEDGDEAAHAHAQAAEPSGKADAHDHAHGDGHEGDHADEVKLTAEAVKRSGIQVGTVQRRTLQPTVVAPARIAFNAEAMAHVGSHLRGRASEINVRVGDTVKAGDPLIVVESPELGEAQSDLLAKRAAAEAVAPTVDLALAAWERARGLYESSQGLTLTEVQRREVDYKLAQAAKLSAHAAQVAAENRLHLLGMSQAAVDALVASGEVLPRSVIRAPIGGQVIEREVTLGELVNPDREALLVLADTSTLWVLADVPEARIDAIVVGAPATVSIGSTTGNLQGGRTIQGRVAHIAPQVDEVTRTAQVRIEVPEGSPLLRPGMFARAEIATRASDLAATTSDAKQTGVLAVERDAVFTVEGGPAVFVPVDGEADTFRKRAVTIGASVGGMLPVLTGLSEGEPYVRAGAFILKAELGKGSAAHEH